MTGSIDFWFPTVIYKELCSDIDNQHLENLAYQLYDQYYSTDTVMDWRCNTFNTLNFCDLLTDKSKLGYSFLDKTIEKVYKFAQSFGVTVPVEYLQIKDCWFNISKPGNYQEYHQHPLSHFSLVYYVKVPPKSGNIVFRSAESFTDMHCLPLENTNELSHKTCSYVPAESMMLIFRSNLIHMVELNQSNDDRITIAMNFKFLG